MWWGLGLCSGVRWYGGTSIHGIGKDLVGSGRWKMYGRVIDLLKQMFNLLNNRYNLSPLPYLKRAIISIYFGGIFA